MKIVFGVDFTMLSIDSKMHKQIVKNLELEGTKLSKEEQERIIEAINSGKVINKELIRKIALGNNI